MRTEKKGERRRIGVGDLRGGGRDGPDRGLVL